MSSQLKDKMKRRAIHHTAAEAATAVGRQTPRADNQFEIVLPSGMYQQMRSYLFDDPRDEELGVILAGVSEVDNCVKLLGREFVPLEAEETVRKSRSGIAAHPSFSRRLMERCAAEQLSQIDVHSHPFGPDPHLEFSGIDDRHEAEMAAYIHQHLPDTYYGSIVMNQAYARARIWRTEHDRVQPQVIGGLTSVGRSHRRLDISGRNDGGTQKDNEASSERYGRQVLAFGARGQALMASATVAVVGCGGVGSIMMEGLVRLGVGRIDCIDPDRAEAPNLNRVLGMRFSDVREQTPKVHIAARTAREINPAIDVREYMTTVFDRSILPALKRADLIVVATDDHSSRMFLQAVSCQYLMPLVSVGVNIEVKDGKLLDVSGEYAFAVPGRDGWCLACAHAYDPQVAAWELSTLVEQARWVKRGYVEGADVPAPAVRHLNGVVADLCLSEIHNWFCEFRASRPYVVFDGLKTELMAVEIARNSNCAMCSEQGLLGLGDLERLPDYRRHQFEKLELPEPVAAGVNVPEEAAREEK